LTLKNVLQFTLIVEQKGCFKQKPSTQNLKTFSREIVTVIQLNLERKATEKKEKVN